MRNDTHGVDAVLFEQASLIADVEDDLDQLSASMPDSAVDMRSRRAEKNWLEALSQVYQHGGKPPMPETIEDPTEELEAYRGSHRKTALAAVWLFPGRTSREIAETCGLNHKQVTRRLPELIGRYVRKGPRRRCTLSGRYAVTWWAVDA